MTVVQVLLVDDQEPFLRAMSAVVEEALGFEFVGEASSGEESILAAAQLVPDLVLMDVNLPGIDGLELRGACGDSSSRRWCSCCRPLMTMRVRASLPSAEPRPT